MFSGFNKTICVLFLSSRALAKTAKGNLNFRNGFGIRPNIIFVYKAKEIRDNEGKEEQELNSRKALKRELTNSWPVDWIE